MAMKKHSSLIALLLSISTLTSCSIYGDVSSKQQKIAIEITEESHSEKQVISNNYKLAAEAHLIEKQQEDLIGKQNDLIEEHKISTEEQKDWIPIIPEVFNTSILEYLLQRQNENIKEIESNPSQVFPEKYTDMEGIITFRGNHLRNTASYGVSHIKNEKLQKIWEFTTSRSSWGGGAGWTGQPVIVRWSTEIREMMNIKEEFKNKNGFTEVIYGSLDGKVYFLDLATGKPSRTPIPIKNPLKGSISVDPREYPLLYVGDGINENGKFGYRVFSLIDSKELYFIKGNDSFAYRNWGAFDGSALVNPITDTFIVGGENGLFYNIKLNTEFDRENKKISISPDNIKYRYKIKANQYQGIENSVAVYKNLAFFADNGGSIQSIDLTNMKPIWALEKSDDTDATITVEVEDSIPYLYTGTEVDHQGTKGNAIIRKINGLSGEIVWKKNYECISIIGKNPINGGMLATNIIGKKDLSNIVIFTLARYKGLNSGLMVALDKATGEEIWRWEMPNYAWSSPVDFYNESGKGYIVQCDSIGNIYLLDGATGKVLDKINLGSNIESSPAIFEDFIVVATRGGKIFGIETQ